MPVIDADGTLVGTVKQLQTGATDRPVLKVTGAGLMDNDCYVRPEQIATTDEDSVSLSVSASALTVERWRWL